jgi:hypothetical protein
MELGLMRSWILDQFEFENPSTEERLEVNYAKSSDFPFPNVYAFVTAAAGLEPASSLGEAVPFDERFGYGLVGSYLRRFTGLEMPPQCDWASYLLRDGPDEWHIILRGPDCYIRYYWSTTA